MYYYLEDAILASTLNSGPSITESSSKNRASSSSNDPDLVQIEDKIKYARLMTYGVKAFKQFMPSNRENLRFNIH